MLRDLGLTGVLGLLSLVAGFAVLGYVEPIVAAGVALIFLGATLVIHAVVSALAARMGMGELL